MTPTPPDSTLARSRREAIIIMAAYAVAMLWTAVVCYTMGYDRRADEITRPFGLGIPDWALYGIFVPWMVCNLFTAWFTLFYMEDEQLADEDEDILAPNADDNGTPAQYDPNDSGPASNRPTEDRITERPSTGRRATDERFTEKRFPKNDSTEDGDV